MPRYVIRTVNSSFDVADEGGDHPDVDAAYHEAVKAGLALGSEEIVAGAKVAIIEICVETPEQHRLVRGVVSLSVSQLKC